MTNLDRPDASDLKNGRDPLVLVGGHVPRSVRDRLRAAARAAGTTAAALVREFAHSVAGQVPTDPPPPGGAQKLTVRLSGPARVALRDAAAARRSTPAAWATAMLEAQLMRRPRWSEGEEAVLRAVFGELQRIGDRLTDREAAARVDVAMGRIAAAISGNFEYWGVPSDPDPARTRGAVGDEEAATRAAMRRTRRRPSNSAQRF
jgi:hypothetical protein